MIPIATVKYTSLSDIPPPPPVINSSWDEIFIKDPLLKQAVIAYLRIPTPPTELENKGLFGQLKEKCFCTGRGEFGCFEWLKEIFVGFCGRKGVDKSEDEEEEHVD